MSGIDRASPWVALVRVFAGFLLLYEAVAGGWWKLGTLSTGPNPEWLGPEAGVAIAEVSERAIDEGTYAWYALVLETVVLPYATTWSYVATAAQIAVGLALVAGLWSRPAALFGLLYFFPVFHFGTIRTSPLFAVPILFVLVANAGYHYGLDGRIARKRGSLARLSDRVASLSWLAPPRRSYPLLAALAALCSTYYQLSISGMEEGRLALVGLELAVLFGLVAGGFVLAYRGADPVGIGGDLLRVFVGYRLLQEVFVRTEPGLNALPGWASPMEQAAVFEGIAAVHVAPVAAFVEAAVLPVIGLWVLVFAVVQTACGVALLVGYRTRLFGTVAVGYLTLLVALGFVRLAPLVLVSAIAAATLGGRYASLDALSERDLDPPALPEWVAVPAGALAVVLGVTGIALGVEPGGYGETTGAISLVMLAMVLGATAVAARASGSEPTLADRPRGASRSIDTPNR